MTHSALALLAPPLGLVFAASSVPKLLHPRSFALAVLDYRIVFGLPARVLATAIPILELSCAVLLCTGTAPRVAATGAAALLSMFLLAICVNLARGRRIDCNCFGARFHRTIGPSLAVQNLALLTWAAAIWWGASGWLTLTLFSLSGGALPTSAQASVAVISALAIGAGASLLLPRFGYEGRLPTRASKASMHARS